MLLLTFVAVVAAFPQVRAAVPPPGGGEPGRAAGTSRASSAAPGEKDFDLSTWIDTNLIEMVVSNLGSYAYTGSGRGCYYPVGTGRSPIYAAGLWMGAHVQGDLRVSVAEYSMTFSPGPVLAPGQWADPDDPRYRTYKIAAGDTPQSNPDYDEWPWEDGAPLGEDGLPRIFGDQTLWSVCNDINPALRTNSAATELPIGIEVRNTSFALYEYGPAERTVFLEWKILNRSGLPLEDAYVAFWMDPDLGGAVDDLVGCDPALGLGYCYNATNADEQYGSTPPAVGIDLVQGPIVPSAGDTAYVSGIEVPDHRNLPMTAFLRYVNGTDPGHPVETYNYMQGLNPDGTPIIDPTTGQPTTYMMSGDPVQGSGWLDPYAADKRMMVSAGPFTMAPGDSQTVAIAVAIGHGPDRLASVTALKETAGQLPALFRTLVETPQLPQPEELTWRWLPDPRWLSGVDAGLSTFGGGIGYGSEFFGSTLADSEYVDVEIRFAGSELTICPRYDRNLGYEYVGNGLFRGSAWDISNLALPRRLNICFVEYAHVDGVWEPDDTELGGREYLFIMKSGYDGGIGYDDENFGPEADVLYACWLRVRDPYVFFESDPAELYLYLPALTAVPGSAGNDGADPAPGFLRNLRAWPNPASGPATLGFELTRSAPVSLELFDPAGRLVRTILFPGVLEAGEHRVAWPSTVGDSPAASGVYFWRIRAGEEVRTQRVVILR